MRVWSGIEDLTLGMVRVRTFAALRHWLLNYFGDDFAPSQSLRSQFITAINSFGRDARVKKSARDTRIIAELKRCWRRVSKIYWDGQARASVVGNVESEISLGGQMSEAQLNTDTTKPRLPSLILRATRKREEMLGVETSRSSPDLRRRYEEHGRTGTVNSNRPRVARGHARIHSTSSLDTSPETSSRHRRNLSDEARVIFSKNSSPGLFHSFARGDGRSEWPPVVVRADLLVTSPKGKFVLPSWHRRRKNIFGTKRKRLAVEGAPAAPKSGLNLACMGQLSDDDEEVSHPTRKHVPSLSISEPARDRVDFLAAGMWASFISATSKGSHSSAQRAEALGEALVQGYLEPGKGNDDQALVAALLGEGSVNDQMPPIVADMTMTSSGSQAYQTTLSMSEIERRLVLTRPPSTQLYQIPKSLHTNMDIQTSDGRFSIIPTPPPATSPPPPPGPTLRRRPGGDLRHVDTVEQLHPRRHSLGSATSSLSDFSFAAVERTSNLVIPRMSTESRSLRSLLGIPRSNHQSNSPTHRLSGLALDFSQFRIPDDIESSDDENCDPAVAVQKTLMKLEGKYVRKKRRRPSSSGSYSRAAEGDGYLYELAFSTEDLSGPQGVSSSVRSGSPPSEIMVERDEEVRWARRHKHVVDGKEIDTPTRHGPFIASSLFEFIDTPTGSNRISQGRIDAEDVQDLYIPVPTVESALAELERNQLESQHPRLPNILLPEQPDNYQQSLASHLPFILQYDCTLLAQQFTLIEKDILAEIDWFELIEPTWIDRNPELVDVRDWKGFIIRDEGEGGLHTVVAHFNLVRSFLV